METRYFIHSIIWIFIASSFVNSTDINMAGQCRPSSIYREVTLKGGINAGTYKDVGGVSTMEECQKKCCEFPACDLAFMLAGSCYLVGCADHKSCEVQPAKKSNFHPSVSYVTRWNSEGVKHTVLLQGKNSVRYKCPALKTLNKVTLKGGLQAGDFTDVGKVNNLEQCYDICCQQDKCDLAFMLGQNCFSVQCKDKRLCTTIPAQPSIFNPQIGYVASREKVGVDNSKPPKATGNATADGAAAHTCPNTKILERATLKGGVDAGNFHDNGKVKDMKQCRRICCEMTHCHLAFMLGKNCFSVKCNNVDACRAQSAKPSTFYPQISYVRKVGTNELLKDVDDVASLKGKLSSIPNSASVANKKLTSVLGGLGDSRPQTTATTLPPKKIDVAVLQSQLKQEKGPVLGATKGKLQPLPKNASASVKQPIPCRPASIQYNVTLKGGRNAGLFTEVSAAKTIRDCVNHCCDDEKNHCNLALMLGTSCYMVVCKNKEECSTTQAPPSGFNPMVVVVRPPIGEKKNNTAKPVTTPKTTVSSTIAKATKNTNQCQHEPPVKGKALKGGRKAGKFKYFKDVKTVEGCIKQCCQQGKGCDVAYMQGGKCYTVLCAKKSLCMATEGKAPSSPAGPIAIAYMKHFLELPDDVEETEKEETTELDAHPPAPPVEQEESACNNVEVTHNMTLKGGTKAGSFKEVGKMVDMKKCISSCCDRPDCDVAYLLNGHCFAVQCTDNKLCQSTTEPARVGDTVQLAYMNKYSLAEKQRDWLVIYIIAGSLGFAATVGGIIWAVFAFMKRQRLRGKRRLLDEDEDRVDDILTRTPARYRTPMSRY